jgi:curved DNA-binding protein CbpA
MSNSEMKNHYEILGLNPGATDDEIKKAYRKLSVKFHPDKNDGDAYFSAMFRQVNEAYAILSDRTKRIAYDKQRNSHQDIDARARALRQKELDLLEKERQYTRSANESIINQHTNNARPSNPTTREQTMDVKYLKYFFWFVIVGMIWLIGDKDNTRKIQDKPRVTVSHPKRRHKRQTKHVSQPITQNSNADRTPLAKQDINISMDSVGLGDLSISRDSIN